MRCERARRWFVFARENALSERRRRALERHLSSCATCREWTGAVRSDAELLRRASRVAPGWVSVKEAVLREIAEPVSRARAPRLAWALASAVAGFGLLALAVWFFQLRPGRKEQPGPVLVAEASWQMTDWIGRVAVRDPTSGTVTTLFSADFANNSDRVPFDLHEGDLVRCAYPGRVALVRGADVILIGGGSWVEIRDNELILWHGRILAWVEKGSARPFRVATTNGLVETLGTVFAVTSELDTMTTVTVARGAVRLSNDQGQTIVRAAETAAVAGAAPSPAHPANVAAAMRWTQERVEFFVAVEQLRAEVFAAKKEILEIRQSLASLRLIKRKGGTP